MANTRCSTSDRMRVPARPAQHVRRRVPDMRRRTRRNASTIGGGTPDMTIGRADAGSAFLPVPAVERLGPIISRVNYAINFWLLAVHAADRSFFETDAWLSQLGRGIAYRPLRLEVCRSEILRCPI